MTEPDTPLSPPTHASQSADDAALIAHLRERDAPCPLCEYNLRGLTNPRCPECGQALQLSVSLVEPYLKAWITLAVMVCGAAGMGVMFLCIVLRRGLPNQGRLDVAIVLYILAIPLPPFLLKSRRRFLQLPRSRQWLVTCLIGLPIVGALVLLCASLR